MDALYLFVIAAVIASFGISMVLRFNMEKLVLEPENFAQIQTRFFIYVAVIEALPIILIVFGFMSLMESTVNVFIPITIVAVSVLVNFILNIIKKNALVSGAPELQEKLMTFFLIGNVLMTAIPLVAIVATFVR
ncbi:F0F1 ATP synthase subunit C [Bacillus sp. RO1]|uniref:F0F1 ATP synthase subunit C n=1 Tax=Bacillus sp. RO1 TaxID=2722703 RepID=UPI0014575985|nr:F0F1 ATP synthase subunit C [Bacillus sp. RO1]NLP50190.1 F0F1 ATP synthase subunit C [Bacillus sp. RO1]